SRRMCWALKSLRPTTRSKPSSCHSNQTGESSTSPLRRYVASVATSGWSRRSPRSATERLVRTALTMTDPASFWPGGSCSFLALDVLFACGQHAWLRSVRAQYKCRKGDPCDDEAGADREHQPVAAGQRRSEVHASGQQASRLGGGDGGQNRQTESAADLRRGV